VASWFTWQLNVFLPLSPVERRRRLDRRRLTLDQRRRTLLRERRELSGDDVLEDTGEGTAGTDGAAGNAGADGNPGPDFVFFSYCPPLSYDQFNLAFVNNQPALSVSYELAKLHASTVTKPLLHQWEKSSDGKNGSPICIIWNRSTLRDACNHFPQHPSSSTPSSMQAKLDTEPCRTCC
jgi:hypothetical protein